LIIYDINIKDIKPYKNNPRKNDQAVAAVAESIKQFGFKVPIVIDKNNVIVAGHTRYKAAYILGLWLGNGSSNDTRITFGDEDIAEMQMLIEKHGYPTRRHINKNRAGNIAVGVTARCIKNSFFDSLRELNLIKNKHIPEEYLKASIEQRMELLRGLMDTDGYVDKRGQCEFFTEGSRFYYAV